MARGRGKNGPDRSAELVPRNALDIAAPDTLREDGKFLWDLTMAAIGNTGQLRLEDYPILLSYCETYEIMRMAKRLLDGEGGYDEDAEGDWRVIETYEFGDRSGRKTSTPLEVYFKCQDRLLKLAKQLGFSPLARAQLKIINVATASFGMNALDKYMKLAESQIANDSGTNRLRSNK